ncbi:isochorismatase family protein [Priestia megaterium]|nr:isochorismatase family protein [Priestia aryabhattai]MED3886785.1 isochorismatase family protein [Priestia aryabhattai]MED4258971.1 isochorismatase family protein [Priestia aryabhattai]
MYKNVKIFRKNKEIENHLKENKIEKVLIVGLTTPHYVSTFTRVSDNLGFETYLVSDATAAFAVKGADHAYYPAEQIHTVSLATLDNEFAKILTTEELIKKLNLAEAIQSY